MATVEKMKDMGMKDEYGLGMPSKKGKKTYPSLSVEDMDMGGKSVGDECDIHAKCRITEVSQEEGRPKRIKLEVRKAAMKGDGDMKGGKHKMPGGHMMKDSEMGMSDKKEWGEKGWKKKAKKGKGKRGRRKEKKASKAEMEY